jgi:hypothetical protein
VSAAVAALAPPEQFFGNVTVGTDVSVAELRRRYTAVVLAHGAAEDRALGLPFRETEVKVNNEMWRCGGGVGAPGGNAGLGSAASPLCPPPPHLLGHLTSSAPPPPPTFSRSSNCHVLQLPMCSSFQGMHAGKRFVDWYNGHPDAAEADFALGEASTAVVVG